MTSIDEKLTALYVTLNADATLRNSDHLNGAGKIWKFGTRPAGSTGEALTMSTRGAREEGEQPFMDEDYIRLILYMPNVPDMTPAMARAGNIENRLRVLLDGQTIVVNGKYFAPVRDPNWTLLGVDPDEPGECVWLFPYYMRSK